MAEFRPYSKSTDLRFLLSVPVSLKKPLKKVISIYFIEAAACSCMRR